MVWISADKHLFKYHISEDKLEKYDLEWDGEYRETNLIYEDSSGKIWITQKKGNLFCYEAHIDRFISFPWPYQAYPTGIVKDKNSPYYWVSTWGEGIVRFDPKASHPDIMFVIQEDSQHGGLSKRQLHYIMQDSIKQYLWVISAKNLHAYKINTDNTLSKINTSGFLSEDRKILSNITTDRFGNLWITGYYPHSFIISFLPNEIIKHPLPEAIDIFGISASPLQLSYFNNTYWIRQKKIGLYTYKPAKEKYKLMSSRYNLSFFFENEANHKGVYAVKREATVLFVEEKEGELLQTEICTIPKEDGERIRTMHDDNEGNLWIGTTFSLYKYNFVNQNLTLVHSNIGFVNSITSYNGYIYIATENDGFWEIYNGSKTFVRDTNENYTVLDISGDKCIWAGTQQGNVYCYNPVDKSFIRKTEECGLTGDIIGDIEPDGTGNVWILTKKKIAIYNEEKQTTDIITSSDPSIALDDFRTLYKDEKGKMHIGGKGGIVVFPHYNKLKIFEGEQSMRLTSIQVDNQPQLKEYDNGKIILNPRERNLELSFSTLDPLYADKTRYAFRYKNKLKEEYWNYLPVGQNRVSLTQLSKGNYEIEVRATSRNGVWSETTTTVLVERLPAWYDTIWAYCTYILIVLLFVYWLISRYIKNQQEKHRMKLETEMAQMKYRFFTNVSHELRTPLTLIITPLETIMKKIEEKHIGAQLELVYKNAQNLLSLVNQLLDFRKIEMGGETLSLIKGDINDFVLSIFESFRLVGVEKDINFNFYSDLSSFYMFFDSGKIRKMINNLLSNAFKFTKPTGNISLFLHEKVINGRNFVSIDVKDSGCGIPENELPNIFERFHQVNPHGDSMGSGIGLHLVKEYAILHNGRVFVESKEGEGTIFTIHIPSDLEPVAQSTIEKEQEIIEEVTVIPRESKLERKILVVEDNTEFRTYLKNELSQYYKVYEAIDGLDGEKTAINIEPDIIITDLMMPGIDGIELCRRIKNNIQISHIPVILLTANSSIENEERGYKEGADAYISKPFHWEILLSRIEQLMNQKLQRQQLFEKETKIIPEDITISPLDEKLLKRVLELIEINLSNSQYSIEDLSSDVCMSRSNLYRKIHSITGITPTDLVRNIRLQKASELLKQGGMPVVEVAYAVGFNTPGYFSQSFKKLFGVLPTQFNSQNS